MFLSYVYGLLSIVLVCTMIQVTETLQAEKKKDKKRISNYDILTDKLGISYIISPHRGRLGP
jgi:hypothetical protein